MHPAVCHEFARARLADQREVRVRRQVPGILRARSGWGKGHLLMRPAARRLAAGLGAAGLVMGMALTSAVTAQAAVPDRWGFAFVDRPAVKGIPDQNHQAGSWPAPMVVHSAPGAPGEVIVRFPSLGTHAGVVHVTAVTQRPVWCQAQKWGISGPDEVVDVRCFKVGGNPVFSPFTVLFTASSGPPPGTPAYSYLHFEPASGVITSFNTSGGAITVTPQSAGVWTVKMAGLGSPGQVGGVQVTAVNKSAPAKCELDKWTPGKTAQVFVVRCFDAGSTPLDTGWTLSYQRGRAITGKHPKQFAYTFDNQPLQPGPYTPAPAGINFNSLSGANTINAAGTGLRTVKFQKVGRLPNIVFVTPFQVGPGFCNLTSLWATPVPNVIVRSVSCFDATGHPKSQASLVTYTSSI